MPLSLPQVASDRASVTLQFAGGDLSIVYRPSMVTEETLSVAQGLDNYDAVSVVAGFKSFNEVLVNIIDSWDFYEDEAQTVRVPLTAERFASLPIAFRLKVYQAIISDIRPEAIAPQPQTN